MNHLPAKPYIRANILQKIVSYIWASLTRFVKIVPSRLNWQLSQNVMSEKAAVSGFGVLRGDRTDRVGSDWGALGKKLFPTAPQEADWRILLSAGGQNGNLG